LRIVTISDHVDCPSGLGVQHRVLADAMQASGLGEVISLGIWDRGPLSTHAGGFQAVGLGTRGLDEVQHRWHEFYDLLRPDVVISSGDLRMFHGLGAILDAEQRVVEWKKQGTFHWLHWYYVDSPTFEFAYKGMMGVIDKLVVPSLFGLHVVRAYLPQTPMAVIPCGVDVKTFKPVAERRKRQIQREWGDRLDGVPLDGRRVLLYVDTNMFRKDPYIVVRCLRDMPDDVVLVMHCSPWPRDGSRGWRLDELAEYYGVADRILWTGEGQHRPRLSSSEMAQLYQLADLRVSATQSEGFGVPIIEAGACGVPTVITDCTTTREVIGGHEQCLARVAHWDVQQGGNMERAKVDQADFTTKVLWHLDHPDASRKIGLAIRDHVLRNFTVAKVKAAWAETVTRTLEDHPWLLSSNPASGRNSKRRDRLA